MSFGSAVLSLSAMISCSKLRVSTSAPKLAASVFAVSRSIAELMVIIIRRSSSAFSASLTRISRRSARSFTVMPSEKVMVRVIGGGAAGGRGRLRTLQRFALLRRLQARRARLLLRAELRPHRRRAGTLRHPAGRPDRLRGQRARAAQHGGGVARGRARRSVRTLALRAREIAGRRLWRSRRGRRHHARRLRHDLALGLQRRRARRRLAGFLDAQPNARRHEAAGLFANRFRHVAGSGLGGFDRRGWLRDGRALQPPARRPSAPRRAAPRAALRPAVAPPLQAWALRPASPS